MSEDEGWPEHRGWYGSIRSTVDDEADWVALGVYNPADAALIAAAPDLLAFVRRVAAWPADCYGDCRFRSTLAKCAVCQSHDLLRHFDREVQP